MKEHIKRQGIASRLRTLFVENGELYLYEAHRLLRKERKASYQSVVRLFYDLRQLGLIEFVRSEPSPAPIAKRYYRITPGMEDDPRWGGYPHHELYPSSRLGGLKYEPGTSEGRAERYKKVEE